MSSTTGRGPGPLARALPPKVRQSALAEFLQGETAGGAALVVGLLAGLLWANVDVHAYEDFWLGTVGHELGPIVLPHSLEAWVNDALMAIFFFVVGLEIKRELTVGELRDPRAAAVPMVAALGGMVVPAAFYGLVTSGDPAVSEAWAIPMATDIAFVLGVLALLGPRVPASLKLFLLTLAIVDDIGGILVIAVFYTEQISTAYLAGAAASLGAIVALQRRGVMSHAAYVVVGAVAWYLMFRSGVHATIAGVVIGLMTPARPMHGAEVLRDLEHSLHPWSAFLVVPIFAMANAGVEVRWEPLTEALSEPLAWGVLAGLLLGKPIGISAATFLAVRSGMGRLPDDLKMYHVVGGGVLAGIGFTVALFIAHLSLDHDHLEQAKLAILLASLVAAIVGSIALVALPGDQHGDPVDADDLAAA